MTDFNNSSEVIDSREIIERIEEIETEIEDIETEIKKNDADAPDGYIMNDAVLDELNSELEILKEIIDEVGTEATFGVTLIHESYFEAFAEGFASDIGAINSDQNWPMNCIDWKEAADELKMGYSEVDYDGETFYFQSHYKTFR